METLKELDPIVACTLIIAVACVVCVFIYSFFKGLFS